MSPSGVAKKYVGADQGINHCDEYRWRCYLRKRGRSMAGGQTVRDLAQRLGFLPDEPYGPRIGAGWSARVQGRQSLPNST
jgi:hypothetical protein